MRKTLYVLILLLVGFFAHGVLDVPPAQRAQAGDFQVATLAKVFNTAKAANTDWLATDLRPTAGRGSVAYRMTIGLTGANSVVNVQISDGTNTVALDLRDGNVLTVGRAYTFVIGANSDFTYNFQAESSGVTVGYFLLEEVRDGAL